MSSTCGVRGPSQRAWTVRWFRLAVTTLSLANWLATVQARVADDVTPARTNASTIVRHRAAFPVMGILGLTGDRFLLWHGGGRMQVGTPGGEWSEVFRVAVHGIVDVQPDRGGVLVAGGLDEKISAVLFVNHRGDELARWTIHAGIYDLVVDARGKWASTRAGLVPLLAGGVLGPPERLVGGGPAPLGDPPTLVMRQGTTTVVCRGQNISLEHHAPGRCDRNGDREWHFEGKFMLPPVACGDWLVAVEWTRPVRLVAYSMTTGKPEMQIPNSMGPAVACAGPGELFVGDRRLSLLRLPNRKPIWTAKVAAGPITQLALTENALAYQADDSADVVIIPRPRPR